MLPRIPSVTGIPLLSWEHSDRLLFQPRLTTVYIPSSRWHGCIEYAQLRRPGRTYLRLLTPHVEVLALCLREMVPGLLLTGNREYFLDLFNFNRKTGIKLHGEHKSNGFFGHLNGLVTCVTSDLKGSLSAIAYCVLLAAEMYQTQSTDNN